MGWFQDKAYTFSSSSQAAVPVCPEPPGDGKRHGEAEQPPAHLLMLCASTSTGGAGKLKMN